MEKYITSTHCAMITWPQQNEAQQKNSVHLLGYIVDVQVAIERSMPCVILKTMWPRWGKGNESSINAIYHLDWSLQDKVRFI